MLSDHFGHKKIIIGAYATFIINPLLMLIAPSVATLFIGQILNGLGGAALSGSQEALYYDSYSEEQNDKSKYKKYFSQFMSLPIIGFVSSSIVAGILLQTFGTTSYKPIYILNIINAIIAVLFAMKLHETNKQSEIPDSSPVHLFKESILVIRSNKLLFSLAMFGLLSLNGEYFLRQTYQPYFENAKVLPLFMGLVLAIGSTFNFLITRYSYKLEKYLNLEHLLLLHSLTQGILFVILGIIQIPTLLIVVFILLFGMFNVQNPIVSDYVNSRVESKNRATVLYSISFIRQLGQTIIRFVYVFLIAGVGIGVSYKVQGTYLIIGGILGYWLLTKCGYTYKIEHQNVNPVLDDVSYL